MSVHDDDMSPRAAHHREIADETRRTHHTPTALRDQWRSDQDEYDLWLAEKDAEETAEAMHLSGLAALREERPWLFREGDADPVVDGRVFDLGADVSECFRSPERGWVA